VENDPRCCEATFVDNPKSASSPRSIRLNFGYRSKLQMLQAGAITINFQDKGTAVFGAAMAKNLRHYQSIIDEKMRSETELQARNEQLERQVKTLQRQKEEMEKTLYAKFLCVLNEKKRKIQELQDEAESGRTTAVPARLLLLLLLLLRLRPRPRLRPRLLGPRALLVLAASYCSRWFKSSCC
jgi:septal ring factor EnvC (AmiA/AmiB activator)